MLSFSGKVICWLCCTILAMPQGWCCMVACAGKQCRTVAACCGTDGKVGCCGSPTACCPAKPAPEKKPCCPQSCQRCHLCDWDALKPTPPLTMDLTDGATLPATALLPPPLQDLGLSTVCVTLVDLPPPSLCKLHCVWNC